MTNQHAVEAQFNSGEIEREYLLTRVAELEAVVRDAECLMTIVDPRSHKAEYLALLAKARAALGMTPSNPGEK